MSNPLLLIVDGESLRTPGLVTAMEGDGWEVRWVQSAEAQAFLQQARDPDLLLLEASTPGGAGYALAQRLQERRPGLPVLVLSGTSAPGSIPQGQAVAVQAYLERTQPGDALAQALRKYRPEEPKLSRDDIFGDLLQDLERGAVPAPADPFTLFRQAQVPAPPPPPQAPLSAEDIFGPVLQEVEALSISTPERAGLPTPSVTVAPVRMAEARFPAPVAQAEALGPSDFTLSGISGVHDPFDWVVAQVPQTGESLPSSLARPEVPAAPAAIEEYGNYFLLEKIAVGGMAELFKAQQRGVQGFQKIVAIKRILPHFSDNEDFVTMFIDEAKLAAQLTHPNIVQIFDLGKAGSSYYIAMEYVNGRDLRTLLRKVREYGTPFPEQVAAFVVMKVAAALDYAHRKRGFDDRELKLVHRDISPQNVILSTEGAVKLVDFGIAKAASKASHTVAGALKGKLLYMSPEQATGQPLDNRSDLYSLGLVLFELLTGERCFQADSELGVLEKVRLGRISDLATLNPNVSREMAAIVSRALQKGVDHRYPSARFMERDLREYLQRQGTPITEHDVAEYMNALLKGSREHLETLVSARFPTPSSLTSGTHRVLSERTSVETASHHHGSMSGLETSAESPRPQAPAMTPPPRPRWLLPVILTLAVILVIMLIMAGWS
ncbi:MAG: protein kinase [Geothrix sp.]|uniref:protein kinase domain-containing protein n=1 Tax=Geothrix sp. TaxID=1962974 RepID=UPI0018231883|nr:protein kinase [Geothrix sp.]NWJ42281.1 protein kinase [Geothrix sp.]WIL19752.1 MAG: protein kinase [Geothrix sp.]